LGHSYRSTPLRTSQLFQITTNRLYTLLLQTSERISQHLFDGDLLGSSTRWPRGSRTFEALPRQHRPWHQMLGRLGLGGAINRILHKEYISIINKKIKYLLPLNNNHFFKAFAIIEHHFTFLYFIMKI
jgi:hypothetical protein